jgi:hypothetical protein
MRLFGFLRPRVSAEVLAVPLVLVPGVAWADGGGPLLLIINCYLFSIGQAWILLSEYFYLLKRFPSVSKGRLVIGIILINIGSTLGGALLIPFVWALAFMFLALLASAGPWSNTTANNVLGALGTWVIGDNSPYSWLAMATSGVLFVVTYFATVWIEYRMLVNWPEWNAPPPEKELLRASFHMNAISYAGLIGLFVYGITLGQRHG